MKKRENIVIIIVLVVMILAIIGVSYAAFNYSGLGTKVNTITTGAIKMTYTEDDNIISMSGALPTTDKTGKVRLADGEYFDFTISSEITGDVNINYEISAKDVTTSDRKIDGSNIKLYLTRLTDDGEEELMTPEVYNEESSANDYTGRPAGEMSLYQGSMNSSESNRYRLRMYVTEEYNPQGDGGGLEFSVQINVYGKDGEKYVPLTTRQILEDNVLQEEKTSMFNYTATGRKYDSSTQTLLDSDSEYITVGLYSTEDEDGVSYYYRGNVSNNYVQFGEYTEDYYIYKYRDNSPEFLMLESCQDYGGNCSEANRVLKYSAGTKIYWRIVRVNGDGSLRLIYNGTSTAATGSDLMIGVAPYNTTYNDSKYAGYTYDRSTNETDSYAKKNIDLWYNTVLKGTSYDKLITGGRFCSDSSGYQPGIDYGLADISYNIYASADRLEQADANYLKDNSPTLKCPATNEDYGGSYRLKAGLITADELALSGSVWEGYDKDSTYLSSSHYYWTMTPYASNEIWVQSSGPFGYGSISNGDLAGPGTGGLRPVINVNINNGFTSGDGTASNPYVIS